MYILKMTRHGNKFEQIFDSYDELKDKMNILVENGFQLQEYSRLQDAINEQ